jgi:hypothetical protein
MSLSRRSSIQQGLALIRLFTEQICADKPVANWFDSIANFLSEAQPILGKLALVTSSRTRETADVPSSFLEDLLGLRKQVEELSDEVG